MIPMGGDRPQQLLSCGRFNQENAQQETEVMILVDLQDEL
jgi:hypothetical protein